MKQESSEAAPSKQGQTQNRNDDDNKRGKRNRKQFISDTRYWLEEGRDEESDTAWGADRSTGETCGEEGEGTRADAVAATVGEEDVERSGRADLAAPTKPHEDEREREADAAGAKEEGEEGEGGGGGGGGGEEEEEAATCWDCCCFDRNFFTMCLVEEQWSWQPRAVRMAGQSLQYVQR